MTTILFFGSQTLEEALWIQQKLVVKRGGLQRAFPPRQTEGHEGLLRTASP